MRSQFIHGNETLLGRGVLKLFKILRCLELVDVYERIYRGKVGGDWKFIDTYPLANTIIPG